MPKFFFLTFLACAAQFPLAAGFSVTMEKPFGFAWYDLEHYAPDSLRSGSLRPMIRSQLDFPIDPFRLALGWTWERGGQDAGGPRLRAGVHAWISASPAFFRMRDQDWSGVNASSGVSSSDVLAKFSDTYSRAEILLFGGDAEREFCAFHWLGEPLALGLGAGGWRYTYTIFGLDGQQRSQDSGWVDVSLPDDLRAGTYETWSLHAILGLRTLERVLGLDWEARLHPLIYSHGLDDHLLRKKTIEMDCVGAGGTLQAERPVGYGSLLWIPYARFELERTWGRMKQTYYADSPDTPEDETGQSFRGIKTSVNAWAIALGLRLEWR